MQPVKRENHNFVYKGPTEDIGDLSGRREDDRFVSHWQPDERERQVIAEGGVIELEIFAQPIPPVAVNAVP